MRNTLRPRIRKLLWSHIATSILVLNYPLANIVSCLCHKGLGLVGKRMLVAYFIAMVPVHNLLVPHNDGVQ